MTTPTTERRARARFDRETSDADAFRETISSRKIALRLLGAVSLLGLVAVLANVWISYWPRRGC